MNILILDDEIETRNRIARLLSKEGTVWQAGNGLEGLRLIEENGIDLILTDICMPRMDGLEFIRILRSRNIDTEIIVMSGYNDFEYAQKAIKYSVMDYLLKPISPHDLQELVKKARKRNEEKDYRKQFGLQPFLNNLFNGVYSRQEAEQKMELLSIPSDFDYCLSGYARIKDSDDSQGALESLAAIIPDNAPEGIRPYVFLRGRNIALFITVKDITRTYIEEKLLKMGNAASLDPRLDGQAIWLGFSTPAFSRIFPSSSASAR